VLAATNRLDVLDLALLRPGRFDRRIGLERSDVKGRRAVLDLHARGKPLASGVDLEVIARAAPPGSPGPTSPTS
jgi:cell division protease FtsH